MFAQVGESREVVFQQQGVRVPYASQRHEKHTGLGARKLAKSDDCLSERHPLRFPRRERPRETKRKLDPARVLVALVVNKNWQDRYPSATFRFREKRRPLVLREVHEHVSRLPTNDVVIGVVARVEDDLNDFALAPVDQAVFDSEVVQQEDGSAHRQL